MIKRAGTVETPGLTSGARDTGAGVVSLGHRPDGKRIRHKVSGKTKTAVADALKV